MVQKICVIGLGQIGLPTYLEIKKEYKDIYGVDTNKQLITRLKKQKLSVGAKIKKSGVYVITVYTSAQTKDVMKSIDYSNKPLVLIESTVDPGDINWFKNFQKINDFNLAICPHRFNPGDKAHHIFNLSRVLGTFDEKSLIKALKFYSQFMPKKLLHTTGFETAALSKIFENTYRFIEIAVAEDWKMECDRLGINFDKLRFAMNTKWNIFVKQAREGIYRHCLPKDSDIAKNYFMQSKLIKTAKQVDNKYKTYIKTR